MTDPIRFEIDGEIATITLNRPEVMNAFTWDMIDRWAEALDREYGWFVDADPGKAQETVSELAHSDERLAQSLFSPALYPDLSPKK